MQDYERAAQALLKIKEGTTKEEDIQLIHTASGEILSILKSNHKSICDGDREGSLTRRLIIRLINSTIPQLTALMREMLEIIYSKQSPLLQKAVYPSYPALLKRIIEAQEGKGTQLDQLLRVVHAYEAGRHKKFLREREELHSSPFVRELYSIHFGKECGQNEPQGDKAGEEESQSSSADKRTMIGKVSVIQKSLLLSLLYRQANQLDKPALEDYLQAIYVYCGGEGNGTLTSFYLLEKRNLFNPFRYSISEQEIQWMLLTLYQLAAQCNTLKYQLLAAVNMIYKKTANESMFRYSQIAQSIIHLLEDEYQDVFN